MNTWDVKDILNFYKDRLYDFYKKDDSDGLLEFLDGNKYMPYYTLNRHLCFDSCVLRIFNTRTNDWDILIDTGKRKVLWTENATFQEVVSVQLGYDVVVFIDGIISGLYKEAKNVINNI